MIFRKRKRPKTITRLSYDQRYEVAKLVLEGVPYKVIEAQFDISHPYINKIKNEFLIETMEWKPNLRPIGQASLWDWAAKVLRELKSRIF